MGLNHIYKVIWSKTKNAWVVVSEIAKRDGKSSVKSVVTSLAGKSAAAVMVAMVMCGGVASANTVYGTGASAYGTAQNVTAIGENAAAQNNEVVVVGYNSQAMGATGSIAIGSAAQAISLDTSVAIGAGANTSNHGSIAIGKTATSSGTNSVAIGNGALSSSTSTTAIGDRSIADKSQATAVGYGSQAKGEDSLAVGTYAAAAGKESVILGSSSGSTKEGSVVVGYHSTGNGKDTIVIGRSAGAYVDNAVVLGSQAGTNYANSVVIGQGSQGMQAYQASTSVNINGINIDSSNFAGTAGNITSGHFVSIGSAGKERQIKNVAAGVISATSTDAINGSQLYEAVRAVTAGASPDVYMHVNDGTSTQGAGNASTNLGKANEKGGATGNFAIAIGTGAKASRDRAVAINGTAAGVQSISIGGRNESDNSVAIGGQSIITNGGNNAVSILGRIGYNYYYGSGTLGTTNDLKNSIAIGNNTKAYSSNTVVIGSYDKEPLLNKPGSTGVFSQLKTTPNDLITPTKISNQSMYSGALATTYAEGTLNNSVYLGHESYAFTPDALVDDESHLTGEQSIHTKKYDATGNVVVSNNTTGGAFGKVSKATINGDEITGFAGAQSVGAVTIGAGDYERRIQNVAAGEVSATSTDGINGSQLYAVANTLSKNMSSYMHINDGTSTQTVGNATTNYGYSGSKAGATGNYAIAGGVNAAASGENSIAIGRMSNATANWGVALGYQSRNNAGSSIAIGSYAEVSKKNSIAIGSADFTTSIPSSPLPTGGTVVNGEFSIALAAGAQISGDSSIGIGRGVTIEGNSNIGIGKYIATQNLYGIQSENNVAIGSGSGVIGQKSVVIGYNGDGAASNIHPSIFANESVIIGTNSTIFDGSSLPTSLSDLGVGNHMIGNRNRISYHTNNALVVGNDSSAKGDDAIAIGHGAKALAEESISIGTGNEVKGAKSSAIGDPSYIDTTATGTHVQGNNNGTSTNPIKASESTFMGNTNLAGTAGTTGIHVVGNSNTVDSSNVMVMGNGVNVGTGLDGAVVLGNASSADQYAAATDSTINGVTFEAAGYAGNTGLNNGSIVSVGATGAERQIKNVAAGAVTATSTDAVNGSQLYKTAETILKMPINMAGDSGDTVGLKLGKTVNIKGSVASGADVTDGNIAVVGDKATSTLSLKMAKNLTGLTSGTFTDASGNQTVINGAGVTVTPTGTGATPISITTSGINAGNQEIKGVKKGTTDDAAVNKKQMDDALAGISSTLTINDGTTDGSVNIKTGKLKVVGESGANAFVTTTVSGDTITVGTSTKLQNAVTAAEKSADKDLSNLSATGSDKVKTLAQDAVKVAGTGLATVSDATAAGVKTYTVNVDEGKLVIDDTTGKLGAAGATQGTVQGKDGVATTQNVADVVNSAIDKTKQALTDAKHDFAGDDATVISRKHGEQLNIKGGASTTASDLTSGNIAVVGDTTSGTLNIKMAKALTGLTSATYTDAAGNTQTVTGGSSTISDAAGNSTVVSKGGVITTDAAGNTTTTAPTGVTVTPAGTGATPISVTTSGISAGNKEIKNVANGTTDDAAVNKKQMDDALKGATDNTVSLGSESGSTTAKKLSTTGGIKFNIKGETGANALITTSASGDDVTIAPTAKLTAAVTAAENSADKDLSNLSAAGDTYIKNLAKTAASWNVETNGAGTTAVAGGETVNFINGDNIAITNTGRSITIGTAKNVSFDKVTVGGVVIDKTDGINAGNKEIKGIATGTTNDAAVNKGQLDAAIATVSSGASSTEKVVAKTLTGDTNLATVTGQTGTAKGETYEVSVSENAVKAVAATAAQDAVKVAGTGLATVSDATAAGIKTYTVNVDEGKLVIDDTTGKVGAAGATQGTVQGKDGVATTQNVASVVNSAIDKTTQALADAKHDFAGDDATVISRKHGEQLNIKGGASTTATDLTSGNIAVVGDTTSGTLNIKMAKALTGLTSATYTDAAGNTQTVTGGSSTISDAAGNSTVVSKGGVTTTDAAGNTTTTAPTGVTVTPASAGATPISVTTSGISAGNKEIKNVANGTTDDAAVNKKQMDDALKGATDNTVSLGSESGSTTAKKLSTTGGIKFNIKGETGANALITTSATGDDVTVAPTAKLTAAVTAAENAANKDLSNLTAAGDTYIKNLAKAAASWNVETNGAGTTAVAGGDTVNFINGDNIAITNTGRSITIGTAKNVSFDKVTVGGVVIDKTDGINAGNKEIKGIATGTTNDAAVNKGQLDAAIATVSSGASSTEKVVAKTLTGDTNLATVTGQTGTAKGETYEVSVSENAVKAVAATAAQDAVKVAGTGLATVSDATAAGVKTYTVNVDEGKLVIDDTTGKVGAAGSTQGTTAGKDGVATTQNVASVVNAAIDKTTQALADAEHKFDGDTGTTSVRKHGEVLSIKGGVATSADLTTGNIGVVSDGAGTLNIRLAKVLTGLTSASFTTTGGDTTVINGGGVTITPSGTGASAISMTTNGINAGGKEIKGVANATSADAAVNKGQLDAAVLAAAGGALSIEKVEAGSTANGKLAAGDTNLATVSGLTGTSQNETYAVTVSENAVKAVAATAAQDAVKVAGTGLATVSDATAAGVKTYTVNVDEGKLVIDDTTGKVGAAGSTQGTTAGKDGVATTQNVASVVNAAIDKTTQALADAKHDFAGDDSTVISRKHGEQLNIKGGASTTATDLTSGNIAVVGDTTSGTLNIKLAKVLTGLTSATYTDAAGNTQTVTGGSTTISDAAGNSTVVSKGGVTTTDGTNTTTVAPSGVTATDGTHTVTLGGAGISAGGTEIKNVGKATTDDAAVNKKQMDDALKGATDNTVSLGSESGSTTAKKLSTTGGIKFNIKGETGANALITTSASGDDVTIAPTAKLTAAVTAAENSADKDLSNLSAAGDTYIKNLAKTAASWNVETNGAGTTAVAGGETVNFINGDNIAITNTGRSITIGTAKNVSFDKVTVGGVVIDKTDGINAGNKEIKGIATGTTNDAAVNKGQLDAAIATVSSGASSTEKVVAKTLTGDTNLATVTGQTGTAKGETYEVSVSENAVKAVAATAAQDAVKVAGTGLATVSDATAAGVKTYTVNVDEGKLVIDDTTGKVGAAGSTQGTTAGKDGVATTQNVASVVNAAIDKTTQALADAEHKFDGDTGTTSVRKHGEVLSIKGGVATSADLTTGNIGVVSDGAGTLNIRLAKVLTGLTSATYTDAAGNTQTVTGGSTTISDAAGNSTVVSKGGVTTTDAAGNTTTTAPTGVTVTPAGTGATPISVTTSGISAGNKEIKNVANGTTDDAAVNKKQMDDALKGATDNTVSLGSESGSTTAKKLSTTGGIKFNIKGETGANALITTSATGDDVTVAPTAKLTAAVTAAENAANKDLSNLTAAGDTYIKNLAKAAASWNVETNGAGTTAVAGGDTVNFINGDNIAITNTGRSITIGTAKNVSFDKVTVGGVVIDKTDGINAGNKEIKGIATGTTNDAAVNKGQLDAAIATVSSGASSTEKVVAKTLTGDTNLATVTGQTGTAKGETYEVSVSENAVKAVAATAAQDAVKVAGTGLATVSDATAAGVKTYTVNVDEGKLVIDDTTGKVGAAGSTQGTTAGKDGVATTQNVASVVNAAIDKTTQALADAKHDFAGDDSTVISRKHGEKLNIKGGASTTAADLTSGNIAVLGDAATGTLNIRMAKALTGLSSATFTTPSGTTVINGGGMTITPSTTGAAPISITTGGINAGNTEIKNVAAGTTPNSAVNKQQMDSAISNATANVGFNTAGNTGTGSVSNGQTLTITGTNGIETNASGQSITVGLDAATRAQINNATTTANNAAKKDLSNIDNAGKQVIKDTAAWNVKVNGAAAETVKGGDTVTFKDGDNIKVTNTGKDITIATKKDVSFDKVTVGNVVIDKNTNRISGLANAANNDEAVNLGQMNAAISTATAGTGNIKYKANGGTQNSVALTTGFDFKGDSNIQITADPANSGVINYKLNPALTGITSISGGTGAPTITLNAGSGSNPGNVSINSNLDMGGKQINNIGAATHAGDAVNKAQMDQALQNIAGASSNVAKSYAYKAGAGAAALAALKPIQYDPLEPTQIMAGIGNYKSQTAVALGVAHYTNENTMFNLGVSLDSHDGIVNAGVTHKFGYSPEKKAIPDKYKGGPISSIYVMQDEVTALQAIVQKQAAENEALRQQNEDMQRKVDMILSKIH